MEDGKIFYLVGPSGSGKDSLIKYAREELQDRYPVIFPRKYVARRMGCVGESDIPVPHDQILGMTKNGEFSMCWESYGNIYGLGNIAEYCVANGISIVISGSGEYLLAAERLCPRLYPHIRPVLVEVSTDVAKKRLCERRRESPEEIEKRIERAGRFNNVKDIALKIIDNSGNLNSSGREFVEFLMEELMFC